jgi:ABC-type Fe3+-hydroxamate transport system substrate-binding protein
MRMRASISRRLEICQFFCVRRRGEDRRPAGADALRRGSGEMTRALSPYVDAADVVHDRARSDARIACLVPSITELVWALGLGPQLVARTGFCIHPRPQLDAVPKVGGTKDVNLQRLRELAPTHLIVNIDENEKPLVEAAARFVPHVIVTHPKSPEDNAGLYRLLGGIFGREERAESLCAALGEAMASARMACAALPRERVLYLIWKAPWMSVSRDTYISRTLAAVGWDTVPAECAQRYPVVDLARAAAGADRVLLSTEPFSFGPAHVAQLQHLTAGRPVTLIDGEMTSWYGPRAIEGFRYLAKLRPSLA